MESNFFTTQYRETFGSEAVDAVLELLETEQETEAFFGLYAQLDLLIAEDNVDVTVADFYNTNDWSPENMVAAAWEQAELARKQSKPCAKTARAIAAAIADVIEIAQLDAAAHKAAEEGDDERATTLLERARAVEIVAETARSARSKILADVAVEAEIECEPKAEPVTPTEVIPLGSGLRIRCDGDEESAAAPAPESDDNSVKLNSGLKIRFD